MNRLFGTVVAVESDGDLSLVDVDVKGHRMSALIVERPDLCPYLREGAPVEIFFKETEVSIAKGLSGLISLNNRFFSPVLRMRAEGLLCELVLDFEGEPVVSIITTRSATRLGVAPGESVEWLIKANEISLREAERDA
jgi:molybdopterin-binding protein